MTRGTLLEGGRRQGGVGILEHFDTLGLLTFLFQGGSVMARLQELGPFRLLLGVLQKGITSQ
jgi:hypothetical protein